MRFPQKGKKWVAVVSTGLRNIVQNAFLSHRATDRNVSWLQATHLMNGSVSSWITTPPYPHRRTEAYLINKENAPIVNICNEFHEAFSVTCSSNKGVFVISSYRKEMNPLQTIVELSQASVNNRWRWRDSQFCGTTIRQCLQRQRAVVIDPAQKRRFLLIIQTSYSVASS